MAQDSAPEATPRKEGVLRIVCFGDSITGDRPGVAYQHQYIKWTDLLELTLQTGIGAAKAEVLNMGDATFKRGDRPGAINRVV